MLFSVFSTLFFLGLDYTHCERLKDQIYSSISGSNACFRRLNGTHQAGCSSPRNGAVGVVQMISNIDDAKWIVTEADAGPYIAVVNTLLINDIIETFMEKPENIAGVLVYDKKEGVNRAKSFSLESQCPNEYYSDSQSQCSSAKPGSAWNPKGSGLIRRDIPFSVIFSPAEHNDDIDKIEECFQRYNTDRKNQRGNPLCAIEMNTFMYAAVSTELCMRRSHDSSFFTATKVCDPIGDYNVYYPLFPRVKNNNVKENITLVTARIDAASLFDSISPGAASSVVGTVALVSTAVLLSKMLPAADREKYDNNILFTFFNGEAFDYIGSQRVAYDLNRTAWPVHNPLLPENIKLHIEVGQIGGSLQNQDTQTPNPKWPMYAFTPNDQYNSEILTFTNEMSTNYNEYGESLLPKFTNNTPPSSLHSFRRILKQYTDTTLPEVLLVDHEDTFTNMYYNSALDEYYQLGYDYRNITIGTDGTFKTTEELISSGVMKETDMQVKISRLVTALARTLYKRVADEDYKGGLTASAHLVDEILYCFTRSQACPLMQAANLGHKTNDDLPNTPPFMYASVTHYASNPSLYLGHLLVLLAGTEVPLNKSQCRTMITSNAVPECGDCAYYWLSGWNHTGVCLRTAMNMSIALSPAFIITDYDMKSGQYSTWTESVWQGMSARLFVRAGGAGATAAAVSGFAVTAFATLITFWLKKHNSIVFVNTGTLTATDEAASGILRTVNC